VKSPGDRTQSLEKRAATWIIFQWLLGSWHVALQERHDTRVFVNDSCIFSVGKGGITLSESGNHDKLALLNSLIGSMCCHDLNGK
jgi:hypothetical protein